MLCQYDTILPVCLEKNFVYLHWGPLGWGPLGWGPLGCAREGRNTLGCPSIYYISAQAIFGMQSVMGQPSQTFISVLYGQKSEFFVYAMVLGYCLMKFCDHVPRCLLVGQHSEFAREMCLKALKCFWQIEVVEEIECPNATKTPRHQGVFTKLYIFAMKVEKVVFLDLDILVRSKKIGELFEIPAPAGMFHGMTQMVLKHGQIIDQSEFDSSCSGCVNAGVLRIDPLQTDAEQHCQKRTLEKLALCIPATEATMLPEQYFLVRHVPGPWHHVSALWNYEVGASVQIQNGDIEVYNTGEWADVNPADAVVFHFSGLDCSPWYYLVFDVAKVYEEVQTRYGWRDHSGSIAIAIQEWVSCVKEVQQFILQSLQCVSALGKSCTTKANWTAAHMILNSAVCHLKEDICTCQFHSGWNCEECGYWYFETFQSCGRWLCMNCVLSSVARSQKTPDNIQDLQGVWVDRWTGMEALLKFSSTDIHSLNLLFGWWSGTLKFKCCSELRSIQIMWHDGNWSCTGVLEGHVIKFENDAEWLHLIVEDIYP